MEEAFEEQQYIEDNFEPQINIVEDIFDERQHIINNFDSYISIMEEYLTNRLIQVLEYKINIDDFINECLKYGDIFAVMRYDAEKDKLKCMSCYNANYSLIHLLLGERQRKTMGFEYAYNQCRNSLKVCKRISFDS